MDTRHQGELVAQARRFMYRQRRNLLLTISLSCRGRFWLQIQPPLVESRRLQLHKGRNAAVRTKGFFKQS